MLPFAPARRQASRTLVLSEFYSAGNLSSEILRMLTKTILLKQQLRRIAEPHGAPLYPHMHRFAGLFAASLKNPTSPMVVAEKMLEIIESGTGKLRHPAGPDAEPFLQWRASLTDEQWVDWGATDDNNWYQLVERDFGLDARLEKEMTITIVHPPEIKEEQVKVN